MIGRLSQVFQFFAFELFVKFFSKIPQNSHQKVAISRYTMKPSLNVSRNFVLYAQIRAACKKWYKSYGSKKSSVPEKFSLVYSAVSLVNRSSRQDPTRGRKKSGDISPPPRLTNAKTSVFLRLNAFFSKNDVRCAKTRYFA